MEVIKMGIAIGLCKYKNGNQQYKGREPLNRKSPGT
jgi:hypothetical protein